MLNREKITEHTQVEGRHIIPYYVLNYQTQDGMGFKYFVRLNRTSLSVPLQKRQKELLKWEYAPNEGTDKKL